MNISDIIEEFIKETMGTDNTLNLSRNELAQYFDCAPSQINYVLSTRFTVDKGFVVDSKRGGGGYISIVRLSPDRDRILSQIDVHLENGGLSFLKSCNIVDFLKDGAVIDEREAEILKAVLSDKALALPIDFKDTIRANILKSVLLSLTKQEY